MIENLDRFNFRDKFFISRLAKKLARNANTDNKGHLFVTVFELPAFYIMTLILLHPDTAPVHALNLVYLDKFLTPSAVCNATLHQCY